MIWLWLVKRVSCSMCVCVQLNRVKLVEKEKSALEGEKNKAVEFLSLENDVFKKRNLLCQFYV